jgi:hypothetical protein
MKQLETLEPRALTIAHESVFKVAMQLRDKLITPGEANEQLLSIVVGMKVALYNEFIGDIMDKLGDIEQLFNDVQGEVDNLDFMTE